ncbi:hypothetical protein [Actinoplanes sp. NPDC089786]|uniref:hypothetical protein n=1 Tax=Actinoplanes sp. NPDC089786 TaxID=3155185 RepID=UPI00343EF2C5
MHPVENNGLIMSGGSFTAEAVAIGNRARAVKKTTYRELGENNGDDVARLLAEVVEELRQHATELPNSVELLDATDTVVREMTKRDPNALTVNAILGRIAAGVQSVGSTAAAVAALSEAINGII